MRSATPCALALWGAVLFAPGSLVAAINIQTGPLPPGQTGTAYSATLQATGGKQPYTWAVASGTLPPGLALSSTGVIAGTPTTAGAFTFSVVVIDAALATDTKRFTISISDPPPLSITTASLPDGVVNKPYTQTLAASGGTGSYQWSIASGSLPAGLVLDAARGLVDGTPTAAGTANFTVKVTDTAGATATQALRITIAAALSVTTTSLPQGTVGTPYSQALAATGGVPPYRWSVTGSLPAGLSLSGSTISGTPTDPGVTAFAVVVADAGGNTASQQLSITINPPPVRITTTSLPGGIVGVPYSQALAASGGTPPYTWTVTGNLPAGLSLSGSTISGTPTAAGTSRFTVTVSDGKTSATVQLSISINPPTLQITTTSLPDATAGVPYQQSLAATGGTPPYVWSVHGGALPSGVSLAGSTLAGTPTTPGIARFGIQVTDAAKNTATQQLSITVKAPALRITSGVLALGTVGVPYSQTLTAEGGTTPYTWTATGDLPPGLSLSGGVISGTPTASGEFSFTVNITDSAGQQASLAFTIAVNAALTILTSSLPDAVVGTAYSQQLSAAGGSPPYSWMVSAGQLPEGMTLGSASGTISGTPRSVGNASFTVQVTDTAGTQVVRAYAVATIAGLTITSAPVLPAGTVGGAYSQTIAAAGGRPPYTWSVTAGQLPGGLRLDASTGTLSGNATVSGQFQFTVQVSDGTGATATKALSILVAPALLISSAPSLPDGNLGVPYTSPLSAAGGIPPYAWSIVSGTLPPGLQLDPVSGMIAGTPASADTFSFAAQVSDSLSVTSTKQFSIRILAGLSISSTSLSSAVLGNAYTQQLSASGGVAPYLWSITAGSLSPGVSLDPAAGTLSGIPSATGTFSFTLHVSDAGGLTAVRELLLLVTPAAMPSVSINGGADVVDPLQQPPVSIVLGSVYPVQITGRLTLSFTSDAVAPADDPAVQFATGGRTASFTIPANADTAAFSIPSLTFQTGTVAGTITLTPVLQAGGADITPPDGAVRIMRVIRSEPRITAGSGARNSSGFQLSITGFSTSRELVAAQVTFTPSAGGNLQTSEVSIPLTDFAAKWFQDPVSNRYGSRFALVLPFTTQGDPAAVASATVKLTNQSGTSKPITITF